MGFFDDPSNQPPTSAPGPVASAPGPVSGTYDPKNPNGGITPTAPTGGNSAANQALWQQAGQDPKKFIQLFAQANGIQAQQTPEVTRRIVDALKSVGVNADYETPDEYGRSAGLMLNGVPYKMIDGSNNWMLDTYINAEGANPGTMPPGWSAGGGRGSLWNTLPSEQEAIDMPGMQYAINEANRSLQAGAAAKGTLLNARTQEGIGKSLVGTALSQGYIPLAQLKLGYNQANTGNLFNLSQLGLNATSVGNQ